MKILMINTFCGFKGGIEKYVYDVSKLLKNSGYNVYGLFESFLPGANEYCSMFKEVFLYDNNNIDRIINVIRKAGIRIVFIHKTTDIYLINKLNENFRTISIIHDHDYYCIRKHKYFPFSRKNCYQNFQPFRCSFCSGLIEKSPKSVLGLKAVNPLQQRNLLCQIKNCDRFIVLSDYMKENLIINGFDDRRIIKLYPLVEPQGSPPYRKNTGTVRLLFSGQIIRGKGLDLMIKALQLVKNNFYLDIAGRGNDEKHIRKLILEAGLVTKIKMHGFCIDMGRFYSQADIILTSSRWQEPFGLVGVEAFSYAKPVIAFDVGGISEWLKDDFNGFLIKQHDVKSFAAKIDLLINDREKARSFGNNGFNLICRQYSKQHFLERFSKLCAFRP
jgi:glycosyltransferase involved in cell wall biosynthesis